MVRVRENMCGEGTGCGVCRIRGNWWKNPKKNGEGRHRVHESTIQKAVNGAARKVGSAKRATCHAFRYFFATQLPERGYDIRTGQESLGHREVKTTRICTHFLNWGVKGPVDDIAIHRCYEETIWPLLGMRR